MLLRSFCTRHNVPAHIGSMILHNYDFLYVNEVMQGTGISLQQVQPYISFLGSSLQLAGALLLAVLFLVMRSQARRRRYCLTWGLGWLMLSAALLAVVWRYTIMPSISALPPDDAGWRVQLLYAAYQFFKISYYGCLAGGVLLYVRGQLPRHFVRSQLACSALYVLISVWYATSLNQFVMLQAPAAVAATASSALLLYGLPASRRSAGGLVMATVFALMALLWLLYFPAFGLVDARAAEYPGPALLGFLVRYNSYFDLVTHLALGYAMVVVLLRDAQREALDAQAQLALAHDYLRRANLHDSVTGSLNRHAFDQGLGLEAARATLGAVLLLDLDNLEAVNAAHGHTAGDALLRQLVGQLRPELRAADTLYRWGGDEFLLVLPGADAQRVKLRIDQVCAVPVGLAGEWVARFAGLRVSIGAASYRSAEDLLPAIERAAADLYREKHSRREVWGLTAGDNRGIKYVG